MKLVHKSLTPLDFSSQAQTRRIFNALRAKAIWARIAVVACKLLAVGGLAFLPACAGGTGSGYSYHRSWEWSWPPKKQQSKPQSRTQQVATQRTKPLTPAERAQARRNVEGLAALAIWGLDSANSSSPPVDENQRIFDENRHIMEAERAAGLRSN